MSNDPLLATLQPAQSVRLNPERARAWAAAAGTGVAGTRLSSLDTSVMQDLLRFDRVGGPGPGLEVLEVMAAALRHRRSLRIELQHESRELTWTVFPNQRLLHCAHPADGLRRLRLTRLRVERVEPARLEPPAADSNAPNTYALGPLLWALAMNGARSELLPEVAGPVAYRIAPGANLAGLHRLEQGATLAAAVARLQRHTTALVDIEGWPGFHRERAQRLVNGLYLNAALMVSRTHPAAINEQGRRHRAA